MEILWRDPSALSVADVLEILRQKKSVAYTTVMTLLDKMARKGSLERVKRGKAYFYLPCVSRSEVIDFLVQEFTANYSIHLHKSSAHTQERVQGNGAEMDVILL